ncbi:MAG TPA: hypothetical protein VNW15_00760 [Rhizomicrobium sp.]|nr:hypothetical protein [Rhizomicrobium sp.]
MTKYVALYLTPPDVIADWQKTDAGTRKAAEEKMQNDWKAWMGANAKMILSTEVGGKTKRVTANGIADAKNDIMLYTFVEADSHEAAAKPFASHPHLQIPKSSIEVMEVRAM